MCAGGFGGGGGGGGRPKVPKVSINLPTPQEIVEKVDDTYQGSDVDLTLELMSDTVESVAKGKPVGYWEKTAEEGEKFQENLQEAGENISETGENILETLESNIETGFGVSGQMGQNLANQINPQNPIASDDEMNAMASLEGDPRLASLRSRMRRRRARGKSQLRKGGGLYIPLKAGIQVQT